MKNPTVPDGHEWNLVRIPQAHKKAEPHGSAESCCMRFDTNRTQNAPMTDSTTRIGYILTCADSVVNPRQMGLPRNSEKPARNPIYMPSMS